MINRRLDSSSNVFSQRDISHEGDGVWPAGQGHLLERLSAACQQTKRVSACREQMGERLSNTARCSGD
jgi:hypothetical protein